MSSIACPRCGASNVATARYCLSCGNPLVAGAPQITPPVVNAPQAQPYPYGSAAGYWEHQQASRIDHTKTGLLLLIIGLALSWIPLIGAVGGLVALIGALLVILGRGAFGREHSRNAILALIVFFVGVGVTIVGFVLLFFLAFSLRAGPSSIVQPFAWFGIVSIVGGAVTGISEVLLTYALQLSTGRVLLWTAYAASIAISIVNLVFILPIFNGTGGFLFPAIFVTAFLGIIPAMLYAVAYYLARQRIVHREIPSPITPQPYMAPSGGMPPTSGGG
jgi:hypothetical protein